MTRVRGGVAGSIAMRTRKELEMQRPENNEMQRPENRVSHCDCTCKDLARCRLATACPGLVTGLVTWTGLFRVPSGGLVIQAKRPETLSLRPSLIVIF